jgi:TolA-binding protein
MPRRLRCSSALVVLVLSGLLLLSLPSPARALDEPERLWLVGERASADGLHALARRMLERFVAQYPTDPRLPSATLLLGKARLALNEPEPALEAFRRALTFEPPPGQPQEARFWEGEALFRLKRFSEARAAYDDVLRLNAASAMAPDALYGFAWSELELNRPEAAVTAFRDLLATWPQHGLAPAATLQLARALVELRRFAEALPLLQDFPAKHPNHKLTSDAQYLLGWARIGGGDARGGVADLRAFVAANPTHEQAPAARRLITETLGRSGDRDELLETYKTLMDQDPPTPQGLAEAASIAGRLGRVRDQEAAWRKLRTQFPEHVLARRAALEQASAAFKRKEWKDAAALAQAAAQSDEDSVRSEAWLLAGESELKLKRYPTAVKAFEAVAAVKDADPGVRYRALAGLGLAREEQQEWRAALTAYETVASQSPEDTLRRWARERASFVKSRLNTAPARPAPPEKKPKSPS